LGPNQYAFASGAQTYTINIPADYTEDEYMMSNGVIKVRGYGSVYGAHRKISIQHGVSPNFTVGVMKSFFGALPENVLNTGIAPTVPENLQLNKASGGYMLTWSASTDNVAVTGYNVYIDGELYNTTANPAQYITSLAKATEYLFEVEAFDAGGNISDKGILSYTAPDETAPTVPTNLAGVPAETSIALTWTASTDNVAVTGYNVYVDGALKETVMETSCDLTALTAATVYAFEVEAFDAAGNVSAKASISVTTIDTTAPSAPTNLAGVPAETSIALTWTASTDNVTVTGYNVYVVEN
jgi:Fibronectin type III domain.